MPKHIRDHMLDALRKAEETQSCIVVQTYAERKWLDRAVARGELVRPAPSVFARTEYWESLKPQAQAIHIMKGLAKLHPNWVFAGTSAAIVHGLEVSNQDASMIVRATNRKSHVDQSSSYKRVLVTNDPIVTRNGIRVTSFVRTVYDCMRTLSFPAALAIADSALCTKGISAKRLEQNLRKRCGHKPGIQRVYAILSLADGRAENGGESRVRAQIMRLGFEIPELQFKVADPLDGKSEYRVDFAWNLSDGSYVFGELDGKDKYTDQDMTGGKDVDDVLLGERRREARITVCDRPVRVMRFSFAEACDDEYFTKLLVTYGIPRVGEPSVLAQCLAA